MNEITTHHQRTSAAEETSPNPIGDIHRPHEDSLRNNVTQHLDVVRSSWTGVKESLKNHRTPTLRKKFVSCRSRGLDCSVQQVFPILLLVSRTVATGASLPLAGASATSPPPQIPANVLAWLCEGRSVAVIVVEPADWRVAAAAQSLLQTLATSQTPPRLSLTVRSASDTAALPSHQPAYAVVAADAAAARSFAASWRRREFLPSSRLLLLLPAAAEPEAAELLRRLWASQRLVHALVLQGETGAFLVHDPFAPAPAAAEERGTVRRFSAEEFAARNVAEDFREMLRDFRGFPLVWGGYPSGYTLQETDGSITGRNYDGMKYVSAVLNLDLTARLPLFVESEAEADRNRSVDAMMAAYSRGEMDVVLNSFLMGRADTVEGAYATYALDNIAVCTLVPLAAPVPLWLSPFLCFDPPTWALMLLTCVCCAEAWRRVCGSGARSWLARAAELLPALASASCPRLVADARSHSQRLLLTFVLLFSLVAANAFQGALVNLITKRATYPQIRTIEQLDGSGIPLVSVEALFQVIYGADVSATYRRLAQRIRVQPSPPPPTDPAAAYLVACKRELKWFRMYAAQYPAHVFLPELPNIWLLTLVLPRGSPFADRLDAVLGRLVEGGVWDRLDAVHFARFSSGSGRKPEDHFGPHPFNLYNVESAFYALGYGLGAAALVFAVEKVINTTRFQRVPRRLEEKWRNFGRKPANTEGQFAGVT